MSLPKRHQNRIKGLKKEIPFYGELSTSESYDLDDTWFQKELETQAVKATASEEIPIKHDEIVAQNVNPDTTMNSTSSSSNPVTNSEGDVSENIVDTPSMQRVPEQEGASKTPQLDTSPASEGQ